MSPVPGGQVDEQEVGVVPEHVGEELLERLVQHRAPPDDRLVLLGEEPHRDAAHAAGAGRGHEHRVDHRRRVVDAQHPRDGEAPHVGVDDGHAAPALREGHGQVRGDRGLADAALAGGDQQHPGGALRVGEGDGPALGVAVGGLAARRAGRVAVELQAQIGALLVGHDPEGQVDRRDTDGGQRAGDAALDLVAQGAAGHREGDLEGHARRRGRSARRGPCRGRRSSGAARGPAPGAGRR